MHNNDSFNDSNNVSLDGVCKLEIKRNNMLYDTRVWRARGGAVVKRSLTKLKGQGSNPDWSSHPTSWSKAC